MGTSWMVFPRVQCCLFENLPAPGDRVLSNRRDRLYERFGFQHRAPFGEYKEDPLIVYFEKFMS